jgi:hypothetical protein
LTALSQRGNIFGRRRANRSARPERSVLFEGPYLEDQQLRDVLEVAQAVEGAGTVEYQPGCASALVD